jgi:hypothetical protein
MLSRLFWIGLAGIAMIAGMAWQEGIFGWGDDRRRISVVTDRNPDAIVDRAVERGFDKMKVVGAGGKEIDVPPETKRAMAVAVGRLVKAETDLAVLRVTDGNPEERESAQAERDRARAEVERLKAEIKNFEQAARAEQDAVRAQVRAEVRDTVRESVREAVRN